MISLEQVKNGSLWKTPFPTCWTMMVQWIDDDQWVLLGIDDSSPMIPFWRHGSVIKSQQEIKDLLGEMQAVEMQMVEMQAVDLNG